MKATQSEESAAVLGELDGGDPAPMPPPGAVVANGCSALPFTAEHVPCLRDCRYYFRTATHFDAYNPASRHVHLTHACTRVPGVYLEMSADAPDYECNMWDPWQDGERRPIEKRRAHWWARHPEIEDRPLEQRLEENLEVDVDDPEQDEEPSDEELLKSLEGDPCSRTSAT